MFSKVYIVFPVYIIICYTIESILFLPHYMFICTLDKFYVFVHK